MTVQALADLADAAQKLGLEEGGQRLDVSVRQGQAKVVMHHLASNDAMTKKQKSGKSQAEEEEEDDDDEEEEGDEEEDESAQSLLFEASLELLSVTGDHAVKGVREAIKRVWHALCAHR